MELKQGELLVRASAKQVSRASEGTYPLPRQELFFEPRSVKLTSNGKLHCRYSKNTVRSKPIKAPPPWTLHRRCRPPTTPPTAAIPYFTTAFFVAAPHVVGACCWRFAGCVVNVPHTNADRCEWRGQIPCHADHGNSSGWGMSCHHAPPCTRIGSSLEAYLGQSSVWYCTILPSGRIWDEAQEYVVGSKLSCVSFHNNPFHRVSVLFSSDYTERCKSKELPY
eukprot:scaffold421856_cov59-Attheya_sp.AAC.1